MQFFIIGLAPTSKLVADQSAAECALTFRVLSTQGGFGRPTEFESRENTLASDSVVNSIKEYLGFIVDAFLDQVINLVSQRQKVGRPKIGFFFYNQVHIDVACRRVDER